MTKGWVGTAFAVAASLLAAAGIVACVHDARRQAPEERPLLASLQAFDLDTFKRTFNAGAGEARVLAMLSPT
jgi:hypothetical protein